MRTAVIVQARMGSTRLPGKVVLPLAGHTVLEEVLRRCRAIAGIYAVVCAIPEGSRDDELVSLAERSSAVVVRGSETDVLDRYLKALNMVGADIVMRITADCPLLDPEICAAVLRLREREAADYASNALEPSFPKGLDCEAFTADALAEAAAKAEDTADREHVTPWLIRASHLRRVNLHSGNPRLAGMRWTLDYPEDLDFVRAVFAALPPGSPGNMSDVLCVIERHPGIAMINARRNVDRREDNR